jgi:hypothetical protein
MNTQYLNLQFCQQTLVEQKFDAFLMSLDDENFDFYYRACEKAIDSQYKDAMLHLATNDIDAFQKEVEENINYPKIDKCFKSSLKELKASVLEEISSILF